MKRALAWTLGISLSVAVLCFGFTSHAKTATDEEAIRTLEQNFSNAFKAKDLDKIMANYEHSDKLVVFDVVPPRQYVGWDAYKKDWQDFLSTVNGPVTFEMSDLTITTSGSFAYSYSFQHVAGQMQNGPVDLTMRVTDVYRKTSGKWLIVHEHISVPVDVITGKADLQSKS